MARVVLSEYAAKKLLGSEQYEGCSANQQTDFDTFSMTNGTYVVKVDDGTKKRNKKGLVALTLNEVEAVEQAQQYLAQGYQRVLLEPMVSHKAAEQYISLTLQRSGVEVLYSAVGGNVVEEADSVMEKELISRSDFLQSKHTVSKAVPTVVVDALLQAMATYNFSFIEINPFILTAAGELLLLDAAVELDSAKLHTLPEWVADHVQGTKQSCPSERVVKDLDAQSTAAFSLTVFDEQAAIFTLLSGGGASLVTLDSLVDSGLQSRVGNYGEYSGAPTREETKIYTGALLSLLFASKAPKKVLIIAGGVANFTDVATTFAGVVDSCREHLSDFAQQEILVLVRRGGPRQAAGLKLLQDFFAQNNIAAKVSGPEQPLSQLAVEAKLFLDTH